ncbi:hypothetical protein SORDD24_01795 [Streptococcus oralis]|uniref:Uncharacterized protein n=1 Tax=Streptococcus oralis TaxID=1303 RepID=A0A139QLT5_STROR|nr:hypothetical protein SORDD24_01795 [Streptococcus oralis]
MFESVVDGGFHKAKLVSDIVTSPLELTSKYTLCFIEGVDCICQLDFISCAWSLVFEDLENFRREEVAANNSKVARSVFWRRFFDEGFNAVKAIFSFALRSNNSIGRYFVMRDWHNSDSRRVCTFVVIHELFGKWNSLFVGDIHQVITKHNDKRFISNESFCLQNSISETTWMSLTNKMQAHASCFINQLQKIRFSFFFEVVFQFKV